MGCMAMHGNAWRCDVAQLSLMSFCCCCFQFRQPTSLLMSVAYPASMTGAVYTTGRP